MSTKTDEISDNQPDSPLTETASLDRPGPRSPSASSNRTAWIGWVSWLVLAVVVLWFPFFTGGDRSLRNWLVIVTQGLIWATGAIGLNVLTGYTGLASLGHSFFLGVGAYAAAYFGGNLGWSFLLWLPLSGIVAGLVGLVIGFLTLRFRGLYLTVVTLGLVAIGIHVFTNWKDLSGGSSGRSFPAPAIGDFNWKDTVSHLGPLDLTRDQKYYFLALPLLVLVALFTNNAMRTRMGRAFQAVRDREVAAELMGINAARAKIIAFVFSSVLGGMSGALFASYLRQVQPDFWDLNLSVQFIAMIIIGGIATISGAILGAVLLTALPEIVSTFAEKLPFVQHEAGGSGLTVPDLSRIIYALCLALFLVVEPGGLTGIFRRVKGSLFKRIARR